MLRPSCRRKRRDRRILCIYDINLESSVLQHMIQGIHAALHHHYHSNLCCTYMHTSASLLASSRSIVFLTPPMMHFVSYSDTWCKASPCHLPGSSTSWHSSPAHSGSPPFPSPSCPCQHTSLHIALRGGDAPAPCGTQMALGKEKHEVYT